MENLPKKELIKMVSAGMSDSRTSFALAVGRFVSKLRHTDFELAQQLTQFLPTASSLRGEAIHNPVPVDADSRMQLLETNFPVHLERQPVFDEVIYATLCSVLKEWASLDLLMQEGLAPARTLLFCGEPGVGKTMAAHWMAQELQLPLLTLNLATVMSSYLGKTGNNVKAVFEHAMARPCVLLLDEFDAIAKRRDDDSDVGELKRLVNVLLQALDDWPSNALLIAATNHGELLDPAVWRRFDHVLHFAPPSVDLIADYLSDLPIPPAACRQLAAMLEGHSFSSIGQLVIAARKSVLLDKTNLLESLIRRTIAVRKSDKSPHKGYEAEMILMHLEGKSRREIASHFGKTHPTVSSVIKRYLGE